MENSFFGLKQIHSGIILIRLEGIKPTEKAIIVFKAIKNHINEMADNFTVIQANLIRIRK